MLFLLTTFAIVYFSGVFGSLALILLKYDTLAQQSAVLRVHPISAYHIFRDVLFYMGLSWFGVYKFIRPGEPTIAE